MTDPDRTPTPRPAEETEDAALAPDVSTGTDADAPVPGLPEPGSAVSGGGDLPGEVADVAEGDATAGALSDVVDPDTADPADVAPASAATDHEEPGERDPAPDGAPETTGDGEAHDGTSSVTAADAPVTEAAPVPHRDRAAAFAPRHGGPVPVEPCGWATLGRALRPRLTGSQVVVGLLCAVLGFALVVQLSLTQEDRLSSLRQSDLVRLLDEVTERSGELEDQVRDLEATRDALASGSGRQRAALEVAEQQAQTQGILSGRLRAHGPGVRIDVDGAALDAFSLFNILEELRNAGTEAVEVNGVRLVASSYFEDRDGGVVVDGHAIAPPYRWVAIGDSSTIATALEIPGGAMASVRAKGARTAVTEEEDVEVTATTEPGDPRYATPVPAEAGDGG